MFTWPDLAPGALHLLLSGPSYANVLYVFGNTTLQQKASRRTPGPRQPCLAAVTRSLECERWSGIVHSQLAPAVALLRLKFQSSAGHWSLTPALTLATFQWARHTKPV